MGIAQCPPLPGWTKTPSFGKQVQYRTAEIMRLLKAGAAADIDLATAKQCFLPVRTAMT
jgi:hypothetical protein